MEKVFKFTIQTPLYSQSNYQGADDLTNFKIKSNDIEGFNFNSNLLLHNFFNKREKKNRLKFKYPFFFNFKLNF